MFIYQIYTITRTPFECLVMRIYTNHDLYVYILYWNMCKYNKFFY